jgi:alkylation response protein AidB-like acyl-CoA dehydrogenase
MDHDIPPATRDYIEGVRSFCRGIAPRVPELEGLGRTPRDVLLACGKAGLTGLEVPRDYGGLGAGPLAYAMAIEEVSRVSASLGAVLSVHNSVGALPIATFGTEEQKRELLPKIASGEYLAGFAVTEAGAGSDVSSITTTAVKRGGEWSLDGVKLFISNGEGDVINVLAATESKRGASGQTMFIVRKGDRGFRVGGVERKMGIHADETCELVFEDCRIPEDRVLGKPNEGFKLAMQALDIGRIGIAAQCVGAAAGALDQAIDAVKRGWQIAINDAASVGPRPAPCALRPAPSYSQSAHFALAECATEIDAARLLVWRAADRKERGQPATVAASMAKLYASGVANRTAIRIMETLGAGALPAGNPFERLFRDSKVFEIYEGTSEIHQLIISRRLLGSWGFEKGLE